MDKRLPLTTSNNANVGPNKTIEEVYQKKSQLEHILLRPDTYIGSIEKHTQTLWVYDEEAKTMIHRSITYVPGLYKIFDEILVNAADNKQRDPKMDSLKVIIDPEKNLISVYNNGDGVPVEVHQEEGVYVPEMIFGHLLTSSNYDDNVKKTTGGRNGYGAKLTNIFSTEFIIETADGRRQKKYKQVFTNNMGKKSEPVISKCKEGENWTKVSFKPDLAKFNMTHLEDDVIGLMKKRVIDMAGCLGKTVKVELNGRRVPVKTFEEYVDLYPQTAARFHEKVNDRWEVCVSLSEGQFQQVSFVNSIATIKGGTHVDYVANQIANHVITVVNKKNKNANVKAHNVKNHLWVFVNALIDNPAFDSQTKEALTLRQSSFGSKCELKEEFLKKVTTKSGIVDVLLSWANFKQSKDLKKTDGTKTEDVRGISKLEDANLAGGRNSERCTLILTEGDSAKALAMAGLSVVGRDCYGVFPLRGKLLNVRDASSNQVTNNAEIGSIKKILGLKQGVEYSSVKALRYGHLMIMTDQDHDGSHIKGLLINFIHSFWPSLLRVPSFLVEFITPIVKATHKNGKVLSFYSMPEYESWKESLEGSASGWSIKYYKGLGTSTSKEGKEYFEKIDLHKKDFVWADDQDGEAIELAFSKKKIEARKKWLLQFEPGTHLDQKEKYIKYSDFVNKELILFSMADLQRSIPSMVDGLKPGQRKILFCAFKRNFVKEAKVAQFIGYVSEHSAYHHGEQSLASTVIGMAQDFVGSNNINLLQPNGQFGTRNQGGKDAASSRYIYTKLSPITRFLFPKDDDRLLEYLNEDGQSIEPTWYVPIIPMVLVNGSEGIGTGWSSYIPNYNPREVVANVRRLLNGEMMEPMHPWYRGFKGTIEKTASKEGGVSYTVTGVVEEVDETTLRIKELPIRRWTQDYREFLESITEQSDSFIDGFRQYSDDTTVHFEVFLSEEKMLRAKQEGLLKKFKLTTTISTSNMHLFDTKGIIKKYDIPEQILEDFFHLRLEFYIKRKKVQLENLELELLKLENKVRFILGVVSGEIIVNNRKKADLFLELQQKGFTPFPKNSKPVEVVAAEIDETNETEENAEVVSSNGVVKAGDYDYLLSMAIASLTLEKVQELLADRDKLNKEVDDLRKATPQSLWLKDLDALEIQLDVAARRAPKKPQKDAKANNAKAAADTKETSSTSTMESENVGKVVKPKGRGRAKKAPVEKIDEEDDDIPDLAQRLAKLNQQLASTNLESSSEQSAVMETEAPQGAVAGKKQTNKRAGARKKTLTISDTSESEAEIDVDDDDDDDFGVEEIPAPVAPAGRKGGKKAAAVATQPAAEKKRGPAKKPQGVGQKLLTEMLKPTGNSPEKKVRKMRASPFNKKSGSVLGRVSGGTQVESTVSEELSGGSPSTSDGIEEVAEVVPTKARPQRANRTQARYVLSDSESEKATTDDSDFDQDED